jgi:hypothetical protein
MVLVADSKSEMQEHPARAEDCRTVLWPQPRNILPSNSICSGLLLYHSSFTCQFFPTKVMIGHLIFLFFFSARSVSDYDFDFGLKNKRKV